LVHLYKVSAKPQLKVTFSEDGKTEATFNVAKDKPNNKSLGLWVANTGNAVAKTFQIDIMVPEILTPQNINTIKVSKLSPAGDTRTYSVYNYGETVLFVNKPVMVPDLYLPLEVNPANYDKLKEIETVKYRIYGDWADTQEGELKVNINKQ
jgi:hypothetical protein